MSYRIDRSKMLFWDLRAVRALVFWVVVSWFYVEAAIAQQHSTKYALLIAVTRYQDATMDEAELAYPEIDAKEVGKYLAANGYTVDYLLGREATRQAINSKLENISGKSNSEGVALIGLWGHGVEFAGTNETMFCPFDTKVRIAKDADGKKLFNNAGKLLLEPDPETLVKLSEILGGLQISGAGNRILLADCCRTIPNKARGRAFGQNVTAADLPDNTLAILACKPDQKAFEHERWGHGAMTKALLEVLPTTANANSDFALNLVGPMATRVSQMVRDTMGGQAKQTLHQISNGNPRLGLSASQLLISLLPEGQKLSEAEKAARRAKAERELGKLGDEKETAFVRGKLYGPGSLKFKLDNFEDDFVTYCRELEVLKTSQYAELYWKRAEALRQFLINDPSVQLEDWQGKGAITDALIKPDKVHAISAFNRHDLSQLMPIMIRPLMSLTTLEERRASLLPKIPDVVDTDKALLFACCDELQKLKPGFSPASHIPYIAIPYALENRVEDARNALSTYDPGDNTAGLLLACDTLLDNGNIDGAKNLFASIDKKLGPGLCVGWFPLARMDFETGGTFVEDVGLAAYIAGRLDDENAFAALGARRKEFRLAFIQGLVRDL